MNISSGDDLYVSGFNRDLRDDAISIAMSFNSMSMASSTNRSPLNTKSDNSNNPAREGTAGQDGPIEVDFYRNPTLLSRMILYNKFANANKRCRDQPLEASVWVCAKRKSNAPKAAPLYRMFDRSKSTRSTNTSGSSSPNNNNGYSLRQLPIHIACTSLAFAHDTTNRADLEQLIVRLVVTYPEGCAEFDHGGKLPLHEAIWSNASPETTAMLLMASPQSIERRDKFGRTPTELNNRRTGKNKAEIRDMLLLGVDYWDQARQEAKLRMKLAVEPLPSGGKSIDSTSVLGTSQIDKETICTSDSVDLPARPKPHAVKIESEEIVPMAWEQLERRVLLLEQLLAEMYEKNYELAGLVEELKKTKLTLSTELEAARAGQHPPSPKSVNSRSTRSFGSSLLVAVVPEDDEMSSVKLIEHAERVEQLESLVGSYHNSRRKRRNVGGGSGVSTLSSFSSHTSESAFVRHRTGMARQDSLVSGLTDEASIFDTSIHAVKETWRNSKDDDEETAPGLGLGTDNLTEMFHKAVEMHGSSKAISADLTPRKEWASPIATTSFLSANDIQAELPFPMAVEEDEEEDRSAASMSSVSKMEASKPAATPPQNASEIYFPGFQLEPAPAHVNSTISISSSVDEDTTLEASAASVDEETTLEASAMSENSTIESSIVSSEQEIYFAVDRNSLGPMRDSSSIEEDEQIYTSVEEDEQTSSATMSTRARLEDMVFGSGPEGHDEGEGSGHEPQRYNYDIKIPALDTFYPPNDTGEI